MILHFQVSETGPAHDKTFTFECKFQGHQCQATAKNKKEAQNLSAKAVIAVLEDNLLPDESTYQSKMEAKMKKEAVKAEKTKKEIRNSRLYNEIKRGLGSNPQITNFELVKPELRRTIPNRTFPTNSEPRTHSNPKIANFQLGEIGKPELRRTIPNHTFPTNSEPRTHANPKITNFELGEIGNPELRTIPNRTFPSKPEARDHSNPKITNFGLAKVGKPELRTILNLAFPSKPEAEPRTHSNARKSPNFEHSSAMKGFIQPPKRSRITIRKDLFESLPKPQPEVPIALMVPPPLEAAQIDPNDFVFEHDITKVKSEIKIEVKNEKE